MSYTKEAISDTPAPAKLPDVMREERVLDPYRARTPKSAPVTPSVGQNNAIEKDPAAPAAPSATEALTLSPQVAALAKRDQKVRHAEQKLRADQAAFESEKAELARLRGVEQKLKSKDFSALDELVDYNEFSQYQIDKLNGQDPIKDEIKRLNDRIEALSKGREEDNSRLFEAAVADRRSAVKALVDSNPEYASIKKLGLEEAVVHHILDTWENDSIELSPEEAAKEVREEVLARAKKFSEVLTPDAPAPEPQVDQRKPLPSAQKPTLKTITNNITTSEPSISKRSYQGMNDEQRWAEARKRAEQRLAQGQR